MERFHTNGDVTLTVGELRECYCVYSHILKPSGELFYVGVTRLRDVYSHQDAFRNHHWVNTIKDDTVLQTTVIETSSDINQCYKFQRDLIAQYKPICNMLGYQISGKNVITCIQGPNAGTTYGTTTEAAERNGLSQPSLSNHLNGKKGYTFVRGMKFKRGMP